MASALKKSSGRLPTLGCVLQKGASPLPGYRLVRKRGQGGFGEVWEAEAPDDARVALKFLPCRNSGSVVQELRNLQAMRNVKHLHLLSFEQIWSHANYIIVAMPLADGNLDDLFDVYQSELNTPIVPEHACLLLAQAAEALDFLHERTATKPSYQHCDVKPSNMLMFGSTLKVADFGLASSVNGMAETRSLGGTLDYCAPEVFQGRVSTNTDQFALAVSYCQLRGGRFPFREKPTSLRAPCSRANPELFMVSPEERPIVARALDPVPTKRWGNCAEFIRELSTVVHSRKFPRKHAQ